MTVTEGSQKAFRILAQRPELAPAGASGYLIKILKLKKFKPLSGSHVRQPIRGQRLQQLLRGHRVITGKPSLDVSITCRKLT